MTDDQNEDDPLPKIGRTEKRKPHLNVTIDSTDSRGIPIIKGLREAIRASKKAGLQYDGYFTKQSEMARQLAGPFKNIESISESLARQCALDNTILTASAIPLIDPLGPSTKRLIEEANIYSKWAEQYTSLYRDSFAWTTGLENLQQAFQVPLQYFETNIKAAFETHTFQFKDITAVWFKPIKIKHFISDTIKHIDFNNVSISPNGTVSVNGNIISEEEVSFSCQEIIDAITDTESIHNAFNTIWSFIKKAKKPIGVILLYVVLPYMINILAALSMQHTETRREKVKAIKEATQSTFPQKTLSEYRFVSVQILKVRSGPSQKKSVIGEVYFGKVVRLAQKGRKWSLIEYKDEILDKAVTGWVFNRYLARFKN